MFQVGKVYNRRKELHDVYGGQEQGGISTPANHPIIIISQAIRALITAITIIGMAIRFTIQARDKKEICPL